MILGGDPRSQSVRRTLFISTHRKSHRNRNNISERDIFIDNVQPTPAKLWMIDVLEGNKGLMIVI